MSKPESIYAALGVRIRFLREMKGITQAELAKAIGLTRTSIVNVEAGKQRLMMDDIPRIAKALKITPDNLVRGIWNQ